MRVLIAWGSKRGGTAGIATMLCEAFAGEGVTAVARPAREVHSLEGFDAVLVGGALYANRWHPDARRFVGRHVRALRRVPVWMFSSGPLDDSAQRTELPPPPRVRALMERVGALGHVTFGGRLAPDARDFPARAMAKTHAGDWRDPARIAAWAAALARSLPAARPGPVVVPPGRGWDRLLGHAVAGWTVGAAAMASLRAIAGTGVAMVLHPIVAAIVFAWLAWRYFAPRGARAPLATAVIFASVATLLDAPLLHVLAPERLGGVTATWIPFVAIFTVTWAIGALRSTMPWPTRPAAAPAPT